jgi:hypothetical protein
MVAQMHTPAATLTPLTRPQTDRLALRREALTALDGIVRPLITERLRLPLTAGRPLVELSIYDEIYRRSRAGGHWTVAGRVPGLVGHTVVSYTVTLYFDAQDRPEFYLVSGARDIETEDATPEALDRALAEATATGPLTTWAPNFPPQISL